jgi:hypothetical protein
MWKISDLQRKPQAFQKYIFIIFSIFWLIFAFLDPDQDEGYRSAEPTESGILTNTSKMDLYSLILCVLYIIVQYVKPCGRDMHQQLSWNVQMNPQVKSSTGFVLYS